MLIILDRWRVDYYKCKLDVWFQVSSCDIAAPLINSTDTCCDHLDAVTDAAEQPAMLELQKTYGKTIHTWPIDTSPELPVGPPNVMVSYTRGEQGPPASMVKARDIKYRMDTGVKQELRKAYLPTYEKLDSADEWEKTNQGIIFEPQDSETKW